MVSSGGCSDISRSYLGCSCILQPVLAAAMGQVLRQCEADLAGGGKDDGGADPQLRQLPQQVRQVHLLHLMTKANDAK